MEPDPSPDAPPEAAVDPQLEAGYNLRIRHPERDAVYAGMASRSRALAGAAPPLVLRYGPHPRACIDLFRPRAAAVPAPLLVFIHGGYWRALEPGIFHFLAAPYLARGIAVAFPGYPLAPSVRVAAIGMQLDQALDCLGRQAGSLGLDPERLVIAGHSAGGQLAARACRRGRTAAPLALRGCVALSGLFDLVPLRRTSVNADLHLSDAEAVAESPARAADFARVNYVIAAGERETEAFRSQSRDFAAHLTRLGCAAEWIEAPGRTHFDILEELAAPGAPLCERTFALLGAPAEAGSGPGPARP